MGEVTRSGFHFGTMFPSAATKPFHCLGNWLMRSQKNLSWSFFLGLGGVRLKVDPRSRCLRNRNEDFEDGLVCCEVDVVRQQADDSIHAKCQFRRLKIETDKERLESLPRLSEIEPIVSPLFPSHQSGSCGHPRFLARTWRRPSFFASVALEPTLPNLMVFPPRFGFRGSAWANSNRSLFPIHYCMFPPTCFLRPDHPLLCFPLSLLPVISFRRIAMPRLHLTIRSACDRQATAAGEASSQASGLERPGHRGIPLSLSGPSARGFAVPAACRPVAAARRVLRHVKPARRHHPHFAEQCGEQMQGTRRRTPEA